MQVVARMRPTVKALVSKGLVAKKLHDIRSTISFSPNHKKMRVWKFIDPEILRLQPNRILS
jgi:hypothetical protein